VGRLRPHITVVGLGPAGAPFLSNGVLALIANTDRTYVRTARHPAVDDLTGFHSFDHLYEAADTFEEVYLGIVEELVAAATSRSPDPIVYAVPGSPLVAERTVELLRSDTRVDVTIVPGLSFLDLAWERLGLDPVAEGVRLVDAEQFAAQAAGERGPFLVAQCWSQALLSEVKLSAPVEEDVPLPDVVILHHLGLDDEQVIRVGWWELDRTLAPDHLTSLYIPALAGAISAEREMARLTELMVTLRARCPWDRAQTHGSLMPHLIEESYEVLDALSGIDYRSTPGNVATTTAFAHLEEELGDLLFQIVFHACLAEEEGQFSLADVARGVHDKLVHRHPHVFGDVDADTSEQVVTNWEAIKKQEKGRSSVTEGIPSQLPALMLTTKLQRKALSVGHELLGTSSDGATMHAAITSLMQRASVGDDPGPDEPLVDGPADTERLVGELLFEAADLARRLGVDAEQALRTRAIALRERIVAAEGVPNHEVGTN
jgi:tetrapyrrole methylase family protein/MazG family protein